jgi:3-methyladenine DNA glycosylase/8-oxoguanine DNA glycosylase
LRLEGPLDLRLTLSSLRRGPGDPTILLDAGEVWRATRTPDGPACLHLTVAGGRIQARAWGPGADPVLEGAPDLLGLDDDPARLRPRHRAVWALQRRLRGLRIGRSGAVTETLIPIVLEQKVVGLDAHRSYRDMTLALSEPAPGPAGLMLPVDPGALANAPYWSLHRFGVERRRAETLRRVAQRSSRLESLVRAAPEEVQSALTTIPGVGAWSAAEVRRVALGDADAVQTGDFHLPNLVAYLLAGEPRGTDARMLQLLEPYRGQRGRVLRMLELSGATAPRFGPRMPRRSIARI